MEPCATKAVFLSYASQDAESARRIADALRTVGVEVWFDQSELRGGEVWDHTIRTQIHTCALFMPVVSQHTQSRREGYFRREWKLAVDRLNDMAEGTPFIVPVCVDDTRDRDALVPEAFLAVQWTRLLRGETPVEFCQRVQNLLAGDATAGPGAPGATASRSATLRASGSRRPWQIVAAAVVVVGVLSLALIWALRLPTGQPHVAEASPAAPRSDASASPAAPLSEARQLVLKARAIYDQYRDDSTLDDNLTTAEQLLKRATELDPADVEAWSLFARVENGFSKSAPKRAAALTYARRAMQLAPQSTEARLALADCLRKQEATRPDAERMLRELIEQMPADQRPLRLLALVLISSKRDEEALPWLDRAAALPGGDAKALSIKSRVLYQLGRYAEAKAAEEQSLALKAPSAEATFAKIRLLLGRGDLEQGREELEKVPPAMLLEERNAYAAIQVWYWSRQPDKMLALLQGCPSEYADKVSYTGSKRYFTGWAYQLAGRRPAAEAEWRLGLKVAEQRLVDEPNSGTLLRSRIQLLALVGEVDKATQLLREYQKWQGRETVAGIWDLLPWLGRQNEALDYLESRFKNGEGESLRAALRFSPWYDPLRGNPRFEALLAELTPKQDGQAERGEQKPSARASTK